MTTHQFLSTENQQPINSQYRQMLDQICEKVYLHDALEAENTLLSIVKTIHTVYESPEGHSDEEILMSHVLYVAFNEYYKTWVHEQGYTFQDTFQKEKHDNILLSLCRDPASIDDLLWDLTNLLTQRKSQYVSDEIDYHISCYKNAFKEKEFQREE